MSGITFEFEYPQEMRVEGLGPTTLDSLYFKLIKEISCRFLRIRWRKKSTSFCGSRVIDCDYILGLLGKLTLLILTFERFGGS